MLRYSQLKQPAIRKISNGLRTAYTVGLCFIVVSCVEFAGAFTYLAPVISVLSFALFFGESIEKLWSILYATFICSSLGTLIGYTWKIQSLQIILLFLTLVWIHHLTIWDRLGKVIGSISLVLGVVLPDYVLLLHPNINISKETMSTACGVVMVPFAITTLSTLFIYPSLASRQAISTIHSINRSFSQILIYLTLSFGENEYIDTYITTINYLLTETEQNIEALQLYSRYTYNESIFLPSGNLPVRITRYLTFSSRLLTELRGARIMLQQIRHNVTQEQYAHHLKESLHEFSKQIQFVLELMNDEFTYISVGEQLGRRLYHWRQNIFRFITYTTYTTNTENEKPVRHFEDSNNSSSFSSSSSMFHDLNTATTNPNDPTKEKIPVYGLYRNNSDATYNTSMTCNHYKNALDKFEINLLFEYKSMTKRLKINKERILSDFYHVRKIYQFSHKFDHTQRQYEHIDHHGDVLLSTASSSYAKPTFSPLYFRHDDDRNNSNNNTNTNNNTINNRDNTNNNIISNNNTTTYANHNNSNSNNNHSNNTNHNTIDHDDDELISKLMQKETAHLSLHNLVSRNGYIIRLISIQELVCSHHHAQVIFTAQSSSISYSGFVLSCIKFSIMYVLSLLPFRLFQILILYIYNYYIRSSISSSSSSSSSVGQQQAPFISLSHQLYNELKIDWIELRSYVYPIKIALVVSIIFIFIIDSNVKQANALWAAISVLAVSNLPSSASSFLISYQRLEGTVLAAFFSYALSKGVGCPTGIHCQNYILMPVVLVWIAFVACFREGPKHGYAAVVASFTPILLLVGPYVNITEAPFERIVMIVAGVLLFLFIDLLILPNRADFLIRKSVIKSIEEMIVALNNSVDSIRLLLKYVDGLDTTTTTTSTTNTTATTTVTYITTTTPATTTTTTMKRNPDEEYKQQQQQQHEPLLPSSLSADLFSSSTSIRSKNNNKSKKKPSQFPRKKNSEREKISEMLSEIIDKIVLSDTTNTNTNTTKTTIKNNNLIDSNNNSSSSSSGRRRNMHVSNTNNNETVIETEIIHLADLSNSLKPGVPIPIPVPGGNNNSTSQLNDNNNGSNLLLVVSSNHSVDSDQFAIEFDSKNESESKSNYSSDYDDDDDDDDDDNNDNDEMKMDEDDNDDDEKDEEEKEMLNLVNTANDDIDVINEFIPPAEDIRDVEQIDHSECLVKCDHHLSIAQTALITIDKVTKNMTMLLKIGIYEPNFLKQPFPIDHYMALSTSIRRMMYCLQSLDCAARAFRNHIEWMLHHEGSKSIHDHLKTFHFLSNYLFNITDISSQAIHHASKALHKLFFEHLTSPTHKATSASYLLTADDITNTNTTDIKELASLSHICEQQLQVLEDHWRAIPKENYHHYNLIFNMTLSNIFESVNLLVRHLSDMGRCLLAVKDIEILDG